MRNAQRLLEAKGEGALVHAQHMVKKMQETGDEKELAFWERIAAQVELLLHELPPE